MKRWTAMALAFAACSEDPAPIAPEEPPHDAGPDAETLDAGPDSSVEDAGPADAAPDAPPDADAGDGGEDGGVVGNGYVSGARLRARYLLGGDGSKEFVGWFDSMRLENCTYRLAGDFKMRCLPEAALAFTTTGPYADAACTQLVRGVNAQDPCAPPVPKYIEEYVNQSQCVAGVVLHPVDPVPIPTPSVLYTLDSTATCVGNLVPQPMLNYHPIGSTIPVTEFVEATEMVE